MEIGLVLFWLAIAALTSIAASARGRNGLGWFMLGFFFSFVPLIILLVLPSRKQDPNVPTSEE